MKKRNVQPPQPPPDDPFDPRKPAKRAGRPQGWLLVYLLVLVAFIWFWRASYGTAVVRTVPYSQFRALVGQNMVTNLVIGQNLITGQIITNAAANRIAAANQMQSATNQFAATSFQSPDFQTVPVNDPNLIHDLEKNHVTYTGRASNPLAAILLAWIVPLAIMFVLLAISRPADDGPGPICPGLRLEPGQAHF